MSNKDKRHEFDVLVLGSGLGGLFFVLEILRLQPKLKIALLSKEVFGESNSRYAQGGIAAAISSNDSVENHIKDTLAAGDGLCYLPVVTTILSQAPAMIKALDDLGIEFNRNVTNEYDLAQEGGHTTRRILHHNDKTGQNIIEALVKLVKNNPQVKCFEHHIAVNLINVYNPHRTDLQGEIIGAYVLDTNSLAINTFLAKAVILATGGAGKTYQYTSNPMIATGDGVAMAYRAGARVGNMEFYQFHPTLLYHNSLHNFLISEAVRGEGARLINPETKKRFMLEVAPERKELATRDVVARAIFNEIEKTHQGFVYLDITQKSKAFLQTRFPNIFTTLLGLGIDISQEPIQVVPAAHYQCGGVLTDSDGRTDLKRLYAIVEVAFSGLHGANRLASNSLVEALTMAYNAARACLIELDTKLVKAFDNVEDWTSGVNVNPRRASQINAHWRGLRGEMTSYAGIIRTEAGLKDVLQLIATRKASIEEYYWSHCVTRDLIELRNIVLNADLIVSSALARRESRGGHYREDFPKKNKLAKESITRFIIPSLS